MNKPADILHRNHVVRTGCREGILSAIQQAGEPLSEREIRDRLDDRFDRTTFYRSFKLLQEKHILHKIVVDDSVKYGVDELLSRRGDHAHFYCTRCSTVRCLEQVRVEKQKLPEGYSIEETQLVIKGLCEECNAGKR